MRILIADDDLTSRMMLAGILKINGHEVVEAMNGSEAWEVLQKPGAPCISILDWMMPDIDGLEVVRRVRMLESSKPTAMAGIEDRAYIIVLTAKGEKDDIITGLDAGADDYVVKPFHPGEILARIAVGWRLIEMREQLAKQVRELRQALDHVKTLQGILPICMHCKKIRNDTGYWEQVEAYVSRHSDIRFSHGICSDCLRNMYPELSRNGTDDGER